MFSLDFFQNRRLLIHGLVKNLFVILVYSYAQSGHPQIVSQALKILGFG